MFTSLLSQEKTKVTENELQDFVTELTQNHARLIARVGLGIPSSVFQQVRIAMARVWRQVYDLATNSHPMY
jgi:hypothetical protein